MRGIVMTVKGKSAVMLTKDGAFVKIKNKSYSVGEKVNIASNTGRIYALAASFLLVCGGIGSYFMPTGYVSMDINPSLIMTVNMYDRIIKVKPLNADAEVLLENANVSGRDMSDSVDILIKKSEEIGYLNENNKDVIVEVVSEIKRIDISNKQYDNVEMIVENSDKKTLKTAKEMGVSMAKVKAIEEYTKLNGGSIENNTEKLSGKSVKEITKDLSKDDKATLKNVKEVTDNAKTNIISEVVSKPINNKSEVIEIKPIQTAKRKNVSVTRKSNNRIVFATTEITQEAPKIDVLEKEEHTQVHSILQADKEITSESETEVKTETVENVIKKPFEDFVENIPKPVSDTVIKKESLPNNSDKEADRVDNVIRDNNDKSKFKPQDYQENKDKDTNDGLKDSDNKFVPDEKPLQNTKDKNPPNDMDNNEIKNDKQAENSEQNVPNLNDPKPNNFHDDIPKKDEPKENLPQKQVEKESHDIPKKDTDSHKGMDNNTEPKKHENIAPDNKGDESRGKNDNTGSDNTGSDNRGKNDDTATNIQPKPITPNENRTEGPPSDNNMGEKHNK